MHMHAAVIVAMKHGRERVPVGIESGERNALEIVEHFIDLLDRRRVVFVKCDHTGRVAMLKFEAVGDFADKRRIAAQHAHFRALYPVVVVRAEQVARGRAP